MASNRFTSDALNAAGITAGGDGGNVFDVDGLNEWIVALGGDGGHVFEIDALNELVGLAGGSGTFQFNIDALNEISTSIGGAGGYRFEIDALNEIIDLGGVATTRIVLSASTQAEGTSVGTTIGTLSVVNGTGSYTLTKTGDPDSAFTLTGAALKNAVEFNFEDGSSHQVTIHADNGAGSTVDRTFTIAVTDVAAPTLTSPTATETGATTADLGVTTNKSNGTLYVVVTTSATAPSAAQVKAGQDHTGSAAAFDDSQSISSTGAKTFSATGLSADTDYYAHFMHEGLPAEQSAVVSSAVFTTDAAGAFTLTAASGAFAFSGETMTPLVDHTLPASAGAFNETGVAAGLLAARALPGGAGSFALTGQDATLTYTPIASASAWGAHGTQIDLSTTAITNDTLTANSNGSFATARGTQAHGTTGKWYCEIKLLTAPGANALFIGLLDNTVATGAGLDTEAVAHGIRTYFNDGTSTDDSGFGLDGVNLGAGVTLANGDVLAIAYDATNGFHYLALNNTWLLGGDPTSGASGTGHVGAYTGSAATTDFYPRVSIWGLVNCVLQLVTGAGATTYSPPSGYSAWG